MNLARYDVAANNDGTYKKNPVSNERGSWDLQKHGEKILTFEL